MTLSAEQKKFYEQIQDELAKVKERLAELQNAQKAARQMYDAACTRLGVPNDLEEADSAS